MQTHCREILALRLLDVAAPSAPASGPWATDRSKVEQVCAQVFACIPAIWGDNLGKETVWTVPSIDLLSAWTVPNYLRVDTTVCRKVRLRGPSEAVTMTGGG